MKYTETIELPKELYERVNRLLALYSLEEMTDEELMAAGANTHQCEGIFEARFKDGSFLTYDLCSGSSNYYDDVVWHKDNWDVTLESDFELSDISFDIHGVEYEVKVVPV